MKRILCLIFAVLMLITLGACSGEEAENTAETNAVTTLQTESAQIETTAPEKEQVTEETLYDRFVREIDGEYKEKQELPENCTTAGMTQLAVEYTEKWEEVAQTCYEKLMEYEPYELPNGNYYTKEEFQTIITDLKENWEQYIEDDFEIYRKVITVQFGAGTGAGPSFANYRYRRTMEWALELVRICQRLRIDL